MKNYKILLLSLFIVAIMLPACESGNPANPDNNTNSSSTKQIKNSDGGYVTSDGYECDVPKGAIPPKEDGTDATVTFAVQTDSVQVPAQIPSGATLIGKYVYFSPEGFVFQHPLRLWFPAGSEDPYALDIAFYDRGLAKWTLLTTSAYDSVNNKVGVDVVELGLFACIKRTVQGIGGGKNPNILSTYSNGGIKCARLYDASSEYTVITIKSMTYQRSSDSIWYGNLVGRTGRTWWMAGGGLPPGGITLPMYWQLPLGQYEFWVSRVYYDGRWQTYSIPVSLNLNSTLQQNSLLGGFPSGWFLIDVLPTGGSWLDGRPSEIKPATSSVGTGDFQATLSWVNTDSKSSDIDLYLYGPNEMVVYFGNKYSSDSTFQLDRDWRYTTGNAIENIYSLKHQMPKGDYTVKINLWGGDNNYYNVRLIRTGVPTHYYSGNITSSNDLITIEQFTIR